MVCRERPCIYLLLPPLVRFADVGASSPDPAASPAGSDGTGGASPWPRRLCLPGRLTPPPFIFLLAATPEPRNSFVVEGV